MHGRRKHLDFELNLVPFIDLLSVCICFLLITAVWLNVGSMNVKQAVGGQSQDETEKKPTLWVMLSDNGDLTLDVKSTSRVPAKQQKFTVGAIEAGRFDLASLDKALQSLRALEPALRTALIQPRAQTSYEDIVDVMDRFRQAGLVDLGVVPL